MIPVQADKPCKLVYSIFQHEYLGFLMEPHVVQLMDNGNYSLTHQRIYSSNAHDFDHILDSTDYEIIKLLDQCSQDYIIKRYHSKRVDPAQFFIESYSDKLHETIRPLLERTLSKAFHMLKQKAVFAMGRNGEPTWKPLHMGDEKAWVVFCFERDANGTTYFPKVTYKDKQLTINGKDGEILTQTPAWLLLDNQILFFGNDLDGKKLQPFLNKDQIRVPKASEDAYYQKFILSLVEKYPVEANGFTITETEAQGTPVMQLEESWNRGLQMALYFRYGKSRFAMDSSSRASVEFKNQNGTYEFIRTARDPKFEEGIIQWLHEMGLEKTEGNGLMPVRALAVTEAEVLEGESSSLFSDDFSLDQNPDSRPDYSALEWLTENLPELQGKGFEITQETLDKKIHLGKPSYELEIADNRDWFDIRAEVQFGKFRVPFMELKPFIANGVREFRLPNGEYAIIPEEWFARLSPLFELGEQNQGEIRLRRHHFELVRELKQKASAQVDVQMDLNKLANLGDVPEFPLPEGFHGELRPYQKAGYDWFNHLRQNLLGGCLADDMGLGKTIQTLALLQMLREERLKGNATDVPPTSLIVMPTSLIHNWEHEARKFTPDLDIFIYTGTYRIKNPKIFKNYDVVLTTYGTVRLDKEILEGFEFNYIILDESQVIKNPKSKVARSVKTLRSRHRLILSGTPIENGVTDLWSQMSFINPGLLGGITWFKNKFALPIEKRKDEETVFKLQKIIQPFVLRRTKDQVAKELPDKMEHLYFSEMDAEQAKLYEETKAYYRNEILKLITAQGIDKSRINILQGLAKLRQLANHPILVKEDYKGLSGKFQDVIETAQMAIFKGHRILVFSQFVRHLTIFRKHFDKEGIEYCYLDGSTKNRSQEVNKFRTSKDIKLFLISIKAGGVGLNLSEADYVFILDPWWNPMVEQQAIDRTHRIGQEKNVIIYKFIAKGTVEEKILALQERKRKVAESLIRAEDSFVKSLTEDELKSILD